MGEKVKARSQGAAERNDLLSWTAFHSAVLCSLDRLMICLALPLRTKSASLAELVKVSAMSHSGPSATSRRQGRVGW